MNKELREDLEHLIICKDKSITPDLRDDIKMTLDYIDELENKINKAIEYTNELIADTKCMLDDMKYQDKEETITRFVEDLEKDIKNYEHQISILRGKDE